MIDIDQQSEGEDLHTPPETTLQQNLPGEPLGATFCTCGLDKGLCDFTCEVVGPTEGV